MSGTNFIETELPLRSSAIYEAIKDKIISGELSHATPIVEKKLALEYQCSRTPIREALRKLEQDGLVKIIPRKGVFVSQITITDIEEIFVIREALEGISTRIATGIISNHNIKILHAIAEKADYEFKEGDNEGSFQSGNELHDIILKIAGNNRIIKTISTIKDQIQRMHLMAKTIPGRLEKSNFEHSEIIKAMELRDIELAELKMREHIRSTKESLILAVKNNIS